SALDLSFVKIPDRKTHFVIVPDDISIFYFKLAEQFFIEIFPGHWILCIYQKIPKIDFFFHSIGKEKFDPVISEIFSAIY
ncbi:MAG: hypothetical protein RBS55_12510, partial [Bacteroidales bacterium]|nr:hypothetical protein [Bacteroidales bacterium]